MRAKRRLMVVFAIFLAVFMSSLFVSCSKDEPKLGPDTETSNNRQPDNPGSGDNSDKSDDSDDSGDSGNPENPNDSDDSENSGDSDDSGNSGDIENPDDTDNSDDSENPENGDISPITGKWSSISDEQEFTFASDGTFYGIGSKNMGFRVNGTGEVSGTYSYNDDFRLLWLMIEESDMNYMLEFRCIIELNTMTLLVQSGKGSLTLKKN